MISGVTPTVAGPVPDNATQLLPPIGTEAHNIANLPVPRDITSSSNPIPPSSLDFLADISARHARPEPDIHPMLVDEQQPYFSWSEGTRTDSAVQPNISPFGGIPNDMLRLWLEPQSESTSNNGSLEHLRDGHFPILSDSVTLPSDQQPRHSIDSSNTGCDNIPNERFSKVQRCWLAPPNYTGRAMNSLWRDIVYTDIDSLFSSVSLSLPSNPGLPQGCGVDEECRSRLQTAFCQTTLPYPLQSPRNGGLPAVPSLAANTFPPAEILDMALDLYFRKFHPLVPFVHLPTFSAKRTRLSLLYVMCLIGMMMLGTKGSTAFVLRNFTVGFTVNMRIVCLLIMVSSMSWKRLQLNWRDVPLGWRLRRVLCRYLRLRFCS